jgi:uncharacterized membrane protein
MDKGRLEAFSDGVIAIIITIMVFDLKAPVDSSDWQSLGSVLPIFLSYTLSFLYLGIYWNNHHHLLKACPRITGAIMWANLHLLFWLSLLPFVTSWAGRHPFTAAPSTLYGIVLFLAAIAYYILQTLILRDEACHPKIAESFRRDIKGKLSPWFYVAGIVASFFMPHLAAILYIAVAFIWLVPDRRIENHLSVSPSSEELDP